MHFNLRGLGPLFIESIKYILGYYLPWKSFLREVRLSRIAFLILVFLLSLDLCVIAILQNSLFPLSGNSIWKSLTWIDIYNSNYKGLIKHEDVSQHLLFLLAIYDQTIKFFFTLLILFVCLYIFKFRLAYSFSIRKWIIRIPKATLLHVALNPLPLKSYDLMSTWDLGDPEKTSSWESIINSIFSKRPFPELKSNKTLLRVKRLSFMYHGDTSWDKLIHKLMKRFFPNRYQRHLIVHNTLTKSHEVDKEDPRVLKGISLSISAGKFTTILGCNGSSKSVFLKTIIHLIEKYDGEVAWINRDLRVISLKSFFKNVAYVDQTNIIQSEISVYDYVACGLFPSFKFFKLHYPKDDPEILKNLEKMEILQFKDKNVKNLSGGEKQKAILARVLTQKTPVIILDEPTTYLDINSQYKILNLLKKLQLEENKTIIAVLHDIEQAKQFSDEVILLEEGQVYDYGTTEEIINPKNIERIFGIPWRDN